MPDEPPNKPPNKDAATFDRFRPNMPTIPGVSQAPMPTTGGASTGQPARIIGIVAAGVVLALVVAWGGKRMQHSTSHAEASDPAETSAPEVPPPPVLSLPPAQEGPTVAATMEELAKPWAAKKFTFVHPITHQSVEAMVIRLPNGNLWGFALLEPYGRCDLEFVTDLGLLAKQYGYRAKHPMVASPCDNTVYDPLNVSSIGGDVWARGAVVQGVGLRPPTAINIEVHGQSIIADRME
jgi:hypothetical protein